MVRDCDLSDEARAKKRLGTREYLRRKPLEYHMYTRAKDRAKKSDIDFDIELSDIIVPEICPYLKIPLFKGDGKQTDNSPSLDRIDIKKGYVKENVQVISNKANAMKYSATLEELVTFAKAVLEMYDLPHD